MKILNNIKVSSKIVLLLATLLLLMAIIACVGVVMLKQLDAESNIMYGNNVMASAT